MTTTKKKIPTTTTATTTIRTASASKKTRTRLREAWEIREFLRVLRDLHDERQRLQESNELRRRRTLTDHQRHLEDVRSGKDRRPGDARRRERRHRRGDDEDDPIRWSRRVMRIVDTSSVITIAPGRRKRSLRGEIICTKIRPPSTSIRPPIGSHTKLPRAARSSGRVLFRGILRGRSSPHRVRPQHRMCKTPYEGEGILPVPIRATSVLVGRGQITGHINSYRPHSSSNIITQHPPMNDPSSI